MKASIKFSLKAFQQFLKGSSCSSIFVLMDENTKKFCYPLLKSLLPLHKVIQIKSGEKNKTLETCQFIWQQLSDNNADRNSLLINLGGGVITDMGGFCAATYMRGIDFVNIPTTLIGMADAAIGGKTGIDFQDLKNRIGLFTESKLVCIEVTFLKTLPQRQLISGTAELFKHAFLRNSNEVNYHLKNSFIKFSDKEREALIRKSATFKSEIVAKDSLEMGSRKQLNLGHTMGHALESYFLQNKKKLLHGEAVALGLVAEAFIAHSFYLMRYESFINIVFWYDLNFVKPDLKELNFNTVLNFMRKDKKNYQSEINIVLPVKEGTVAINTQVSDTEIYEALKFIVTF